MHHTYDPEDAAGHIKPLILARDYFVSMKNMYNEVHGFLDFGVDESSCDKEVDVNVGET